MILVVWNGERRILSSEQHTRERAGAHKNVVTYFIVANRIRCAWQHQIQPKKWCAANRIIRGEKTI